MSDPRATFTGSIPQYYDDCLGKAYFGPPAAELVRRLPAQLVVHQRQQLGLGGGVAAAPRAQQRRELVEVAIHSAVAPPPVVGFSCG